MSSEKLPPSPTPILYHTRSIQETTTALATDLEDGLTKVDAANRLEKYGKNELTGQGDVSAWKVFLSQLCNSMTIVLLLAFGASVGAKDYVEAVVVGFVIVTNTFIGFSQEYKAEKTMESLRQLTSPTALVVREGAQHHIPALEVVPGDVVQFKSGDVIPADLRLFEAFNLEIDEALLTGESAPVLKIIEPILNPEESVGDRVNLAYSSTIVSKGRGKGIVINTGMNSEMGKIAKALTETEKTGKTELQKRVDRLALYLLVLAVVLGLIVFTANGWVINTDIVLYAISVAISVIPEGLVAVMTITMSVSVREMAKHKAIVRKLTALEAIGAVSNICSDKTGTITQGRMVLTKVHLIGMGNYAVSGEGYNPTGDISPLSAANSLLKPGNVTPTPTKNAPLPKDNLPEPLLRLVRVASLCNQAVLRNGNWLPSTTVIDMQSSHSLSPVEKNSLTRPGHSTNSSSNIEADGGWKAFGDPTDNALQVFAHKLGMSKPALMSNFELICEFPFESAIKRASVVVREKQSGEVYVLLKGATEQVLSKCQYVDPTAVMKNMESFAASGLRVLAIADRKIERQITNEEILKWTREDADKEMTLLGIVGIYDPPRPQSKGAIETCAQAGISVHMLTGDHPRTAAAIALSVGLISRSEAKATVVTNAPAPSGHGLELFRSITMAEDEQATPNIVMTAPAFDALSDAEIDKLSHLPKVIARCTPHTKTRMVAALHRRNRVVAMTGDGVNDAPSLKAADVGIAMGLAGSDVAKQASDIVLTNDNFATISKAVFEGRRIFDNIQKFILHLLSTNIAEVILLVLGLAFKDPTGTSVFPMSPVQILWLNMATSSPPAMGLGFEKAANHLQHVPPRPKNKGMFGRELTADMFFFGTLMGILSLANWVIVIFGFGDGRLGNAESSGLCNKASHDLIQPGGPCELVYTGRAVTFLTLIFMILLHAINCRHVRNFGFKGLHKNKLLMWSIIIGAAVSIPVIYIPGTEEVFKHKPIGWIEWALVLGANIIFMGLSMAYKLLKRAFMKPLVRDLDEDEEEEEEDEYEDIDEDAEYATHGIRKVVE